MRLRSHFILPAGALSLMLRRPNFFFFRHSEKDSPLRRRLAGETWFYCKSCNASGMFPAHALDSGKFMDI